MREVEWVKTFAPTVEIGLWSADRSLTAFTGRKLPYANPKITNQDKPWRWGRVGYRTYPVFEYCRRPFARE